MTYPLKYVHMCIYMQFCVSQLSSAFYVQGDQLTPLTRACLIGAKAYQAAQYLLTCDANPNGIDKVCKIL